MAISSYNFNNSGIAASVSPSLLRCNFHCRQANTECCQLQTISSEYQQDISYNDKYNFNTSKLLMPQQYSGVNAPEVSGVPSNNRSSIPQLYPTHQQWNFNHLDSRFPLQQQPQQHVPQQQNFPTNGCGNPIQYLQGARNFQQEQVPEQEVGPVKKHWWLWVIGGVDIVSAVVSTIVLVYQLFTQPIYDPDSFVWTFFISCIDILLIFVMGMGLLTGLKSEDDVSTLWYCKLWVTCQLLFLMASVVQAIYSIISHKPDFSSAKTFLPPPLIWFSVFVYRVVTFVLVRRFVKVLKEMGNIQEDFTLTSEANQDERDADHPFGAGETSYCIPPAALILSF